MQDELTLSNDLVALRVAPQFGARVTSLIDQRTGRDWLVPGDKEGSGADSAAFLGAEARGWDECFPTVAPCSNENWGRTLRDHGDIWGRPTECVAANNEITSTYTGDRFEFKRVLKLVGDTLEINYAIANTGSASFPYMWSQHCLLATTPADRIFINNIGPMTITGTGGMSGEVPTSFAWPRLSDAHPDMGTVEPMDARWMFKAYAAANGAVEAGVTGSNGTISFAFDGSQMPFLGLWLDYGAWPEGAPVHQIAIEPTTAAADHLDGAISNGQVRHLAPGKTQNWTVAIRLLDQENHEAR